ncbi:MAG: DUF2062 domain-containing protein [Bacteroidetes bacterium]|jgi:uncharacterized protein (DUF2062 family)|nr:DUF2062 domain-containing protein [Bacteroidota bacterium]
MKRLLRKWRAGFKKKVVHPVTQSLRTGTSPHEVTLTLVLGILVSLIPVFGVSTIIVTTLALRMKLNLIIINIANFLVYPLQILFYIPFIQLGLIIHPSENAPHSFQEFISLAQESWIGAITFFGSATIFAVLAWLLVCIPLGLILYHIFYHSFRKFVQIRTSVFIKDTAS